MTSFKTIRIAVVLLLVGVGMYGIFYYYESHAGLARYITKSESIMPSPMASSSNPTTPIGPVAITTVTSRAITVKVNETGNTLTYSIGTSTHVYSLALEGKVGKNFNDLMPGVMVTIYPQQGDSDQVNGIAFKRDPSLVPSQEEIQHSVTGILSTVTKDTITVTPTSGVAVVITLDPATRIYTTVIEGQSGRPLAIGEHVVVTGINTVGDQTTAKMILLAPKVTN